MYTRENSVVECIRPYDCKILTYSLFCFALCTVSVYHTSPYVRAVLGLSRSVRSCGRGHETEV